MFLVRCWRWDGEVCRVGVEMGGEREGVDWVCLWDGGQGVYGRVVVEDGGGWLRAGGWKRLWETRDSVHLSES